MKISVIALIVIFYEVWLKSFGLLLQVKRQQRFKLSSPFLAEVGNGSCSNI